MVHAEVDRQLAAALCHTYSFSPPLFPGADCISLGRYEVQGEYVDTAGPLAL